MRLDFLKKQNKDSGGKPRKVMISRAFFLFAAAVLLPVSCETYQAGGVLEPRANGNAYGGFFAGDSSDYVESSLEYLVYNDSSIVDGKDNAEIGWRMLFKAPFNFIGNHLSLFPMGGFDIRYIQDTNMNPPSADNLDALSSTYDHSALPLGASLFAGGGFDVSFTESFFLRGEVLYTPEITAFFNAHRGLYVNVGLGYRTKSSSIRSGYKTFAELKRENLLKKANDSYTKKNYGDAISYYQQVIAMDMTLGTGNAVNLSAAYYERAKQYRDQGDYRQALEDFTESNRIQLAMSRDKYADWKKLLGLYEEAYGEEAPQENYAKLIFSQNSHLTIDYNVSTNNHGSNETLGSGYVINLRPGKRIFTLTYDEPHFSAGSRKSGGTQVELEVEAGHVYQVDSSVQGNQAALTITDITDRELGKDVAIARRIPFSRKVTINEVPLTSTEITSALDRAEKNISDNPDSAIQDCTRVLNSNPSTRNAYLAYGWRGVALYRTKEYDRSISDFSAALQLSSSANASLSAIAVVYYYRGRSYSAADDYDRAISDFTQAIRLNSSDADFYAQRGWAYYLGKKDYAQARSDVNRALALDPDNSMAKLTQTMLSLQEE